MSENPYIRTTFLIGQDAIDTLASKRVAVFGVGGVGGYVVEALARSGIGTLDLIDHDTFAYSNLNRQILATRDTIDRIKVDVAKERVHAINPNIVVNTYPCFYLPEQADTFPFEKYDYIVDAIDTVTAKIDLIMKANELHIPIICAMGCGNRLDPTKLVVTDIYKTTGDPLAKIMRHELKKRRIKKCKVVYSTELPIKPTYPEGYQSENPTKKSTPGSSAFVPSCAGIIMASVVTKELLQR